MNYYTARLHSIMKRNHRAKELSKADSRNKLNNECPFCPYSDAEHIINNSCTFKLCIKDTWDLESVWVRITEDRKFVKLGNIYHDLVVVERLDNDKFGNTIWRCECRCGKETIVTGSNLTSGKIRHCGCMRRKEINNDDQIS